VLPWFRDERCPSGSGWGEAPSPGLAFARFPGATWPSQRRVSTEAPDGIAARPLARETSAGVVWKPSRAIRKDRSWLVARGAGRRKPTEAAHHEWRVKARTSPGFGCRCGGWGLNPIRVEAPTQRKLGAPRRQRAGPGIGDPWLCSWGVLVAEVDERRLVQTLTRLGLATRPRARAVKGRRKPVRGGKAAGAVAGSQ